MPAKATGRRGERWRIRGLHQRHRLTAVALLLSSGDGQRLSVAVAVFPFWGIGREQSQWSERDELLSVESGVDALRG
ncbi:MAG: hypothetical protein RLZZ232_2723 [Planctomycetota bacterium]